MKKIYLCALPLLAMACSKKVVGSGGDTVPPPPPVQVKSDVSVWLTDPSTTTLFKPQTDVSLVFNKPGNAADVIDVDDKQTYQVIDGFGFTLTGGSAMHLFNMSAPNRAALLKELFATDSTYIGTSYLRISIGASDLDGTVFSYNDLAAGETDLNMSKFDLSPDKQYLIPVLKEILAINPNIKILGSPWSPPTWMKTNNNSKGGSLKPEYYDAYAKYFVKYVQQMKAAGVTIDAITVQNEPLHPGNNPSLLMQPEEQAAFIKTSLGPAFQAAGITTKIIIYDHNVDRPDYPITVLNDADAAKYIDGSAFHLYAGTVDAISQVHTAFPQKNVYFTEQWVGAPGNLKGDLIWHVKNVIIGTTRNWCKTALEWNLAANSKLEPHTPGGCTQCLGAVTIDGNVVTRNPAYYIIAHASKFVRPGSIRVYSSFVNGMPNVAFTTPDNKKVLIVLNEGSTSRTFAIRYNGKDVTVALNGGAVGTYVW